MKRFLTFVLTALVVLLALTCCGQGDGADPRLSDISGALGVDVSAGTLDSFEDDHGGFHGDGLLSAVVELDGLAGGLADARGWRALPMSASAAQAVRLCGKEGAAVQEGFYFLYDRHSESCDPYDDTQLHSRCSWNFTAAVYDSGNGLLYFYQFDT